MKTCCAYNDWEGFKGIEYCIKSQCYFINECENLFFIEQE